MHVKSEAKNKKYTLFILGILITVCTLFICLFTIPAYAGSTLLFLAPNMHEVGLNQEFSMQVYVSSDQSINAISGTLQFSPDMLEIISITKENSILSLWVQEPVYNNSAGTASFEGIILSPGFIGNSGRVVTARFKAKGIGNSSISFSSAAVLANDGKGTNVISAVGSADVKVFVDIVVPIKPIVTPPSSSDTTQKGVTETIRTTKPIYNVLESMQNIADISWLSNLFEQDNILPKIIRHSAFVIQGETIDIHGITKPDSKVTLWIQQNNYKSFSYTTYSDDSGLFLASIQDKLQAGMYKIWAEITDAEGIKQASRSVAVAVVPIGQVQSNSYWILVALAVFIFLFSFLNWYTNYISKCRERKYDRKENKKAKSKKQIKKRRKIRKKK